MDDSEHSISPEFGIHPVPLDRSQIPCVANSRSNGSGLKASDEICVSHLNQDLHPNPKSESLSHPEFKHQICSPHLTSRNSKSFCCNITACSLR